VRLASPARRPAAGEALKPGDGILFDEGLAAGDEQGGRVFSVERKGPGTLFLTFGRDDIDLGGVSVGSRVWKTDDPAMERELRKSFARDVLVRRAPLSVRVEARIGGPLLVTAADEAGNRAEVSWPGPLAEATRRPLTEELVREQLGRLGDTPFELAEVHIFGEGSEAVPAAPVLAPKSVLNDLRRQAVARLLALREEKARRALAEPDALDALRREIAARRAAAARREAPPPSICVLVRTAEQLDAVLAWRPDEGLGRPAAVYCDFRNPGESADAVARLRAAGLPADLATPRIAKPGDEEFLRLILESGPDAVLIRHLAGLAFFRENAPALPLVADFSLNATNEISADLLAQAPVARITPGLDLNLAQLAALMTGFPPARLEPIVHLHVPMMYMEHCIAAAHLAEGGGQGSGEVGGPACGRPCERHRLELADRVGAEHPLASDARCGSALFAARVQSALPYIPEMLIGGVRHFRVEFLREGAAEVRQVLDLYSRALAGRLDPREAWRQLEALAPAGATRGTWDFR
jgi:putative protease